MKITTENIRVNFQAKEILKGISIETRDKELVGIIGPNGKWKVHFAEMYIPCIKGRFRSCIS